MKRSLAGVALAGMLASAPLHAEGPTPPEPPANLLQSADADATSLDRLFTAFQGVRNFEGKFREEKKLSLLAKPLKSEGVMIFERDRGIARNTLTPKVQKMRLTATSLSMWNGTTTEEVKLDQSGNLTALALAFPRILRGDRSGLSKAFAIRMQGSDSGFWALTLTPTDASLKRALSSVIVIGQASTVRSIAVQESSGDRTLTVLTDVRKNISRTPTEVDALFALP